VPLLPPLIEHIPLWTERTTPPSMRRTKIVCTVGPAIDDINKLTQVVEAGGDVFRLNFSSGTLDEHRRRVDMSRSVERDIGKPLAMLQDLPDPKIRIGTFQDDSINLSVGERFILTTDKVSGDQYSVSVNDNRLAEEVQPGQHLVLADGIIELHIDAVKPPDIHCTVILVGPLSNQKAISIDGMIQTARCGTTD
jgi:pyruvate kinase